MKCYHHVNPGYDFSKWGIEYHCLPVPADNPKALFVVHYHAHDCPDTSTALPHLLDSTRQVGSKVAAALSNYGVVATDTPAEAVLKVAAVWRPAMP